MASVENVFAACDYFDIDRGDVPPLQALGLAEQMHSELYWIDTTSTLKLAIMARPRAGDWQEDEVAHWKRSGVGFVISLLERDEVDELGLEMEATLCGQNEIEFLSFPIPDRGLPKDADVAMSFAAYVASKSITIAIHCRAGIGRSSVMAAAVFNLLKAPRPQQRYRQSKRREACLFPTPMLNAIES